MSETCCAEVYNSLAWKSFRCGARAKVERDGKHYCGRHDPVKIAEKRDAKHAAWEAKWKASAARDAHERACLAAIASIGGDPATVAELVAALREMERVFSVTFAGSIFRAETAAILAARAVLAKVPENSNEPA